MRFLPLLIVVAIASFALSMETRAATISYYLDTPLVNDNSLPAGVDYVKVTISDGTDTTGAGVGDIDFLVETVAHNLAGLQEFTFNYNASNVSVTADNIVDFVPDSWSVKNGNSNTNGVGKFDFIVNDQTPVSPLSFSIRGVEGDTVYDYAIADGTDYMFSAMVKVNDEHSGHTATIVGPSAVPVPPAVWLFGSGLVGLVGVARREKV